jgi:hypothetical protein
MTVLIFSLLVFIILGSYQKADTSSLSSFCLPPSQLHTPNFHSPSQKEITLLGSSYQFVWYTQTHAHTCGITGAPHFVLVTQKNSQFSSFSFLFFFFYLSLAPSPFCFSYCSNRVLHLCPGWPELQPSYLISTHTALSFYWLRWDFVNFFAKSGILLICIS